VFQWQARHQPITMEMLSEAAADAGEGQLDLAGMQLV
jgi:hypothetical protein